MPLTSQMILRDCQADCNLCWALVACGFRGLGPCGKEANAFVWRDRTGEVCLPLSSISHPIFFPLSLFVSLVLWLRGRRAPHSTHALSTSHTCFRQKHALTNTIPHFVLTLILQVSFMYTSGTYRNAFYAANLFHDAEKMYNQTQYKRAVCICIYNLIAQVHTFFTQVHTAMILGGNRFITSLS